MTLDQFIDELGALGEFWGLVGTDSELIRTHRTVHRPPYCPVVAVAVGKGIDLSNHTPAEVMAKALRMEVDDVAEIIRAADATKLWDDEHECDVPHFDEDLRDRLMRATRVLD